MAGSLFKSDDSNGKVSPASVRRHYDEGRRALQHMVWEYEMNETMLLGETHWVYRHPLTHVIQEYPRDDARTRITANRLWPASRHTMSRLLQRDMYFEVLPTDIDDVTKIGAHTAQSVLTDKCREDNWESFREAMAWGAWLGGTAGLALDWDATASPIGQLPQSGRPYGRGDIVATPLTIQEMVWEPGTKDAERGCWWIRAQALPPKEVQAAYDMKECPKADAQAQAGAYSRLTTADRGAQPVPLTLVLTFYARPCKAYPNGAVATVVNEKFVDGPHAWPFPFKDRLNFVVVRETKVPGQAHGHTVFSAAVPVQMAYNASLSNLVEHLKLAGNARMAIPETSLDLMDELTDTPGEFVPYNAAAGPPPNWMDPPRLPDWVMQQPAMLASQMDDILGVHDVSRGAAPKNIESGLGISVLVEQDSTPIGHLTKEIAGAFSRFGTMVLKLYEAKVTDTRKARITVPGQVPEVVRWTGKALAGQTTATVPVEAIMPKSKAASYAMAKEMADRFPAIKENIAEFARIADMPEGNKLLEAIDADAAKAERENHEMAMKVVCVPAKFDNHAKHIAIVNRFRKTSRYESMDEEQKSLYDLHAEAHEVMAAEEAGLAVAKQRSHPALEMLPTASETAPLGMPGMPPGGGTPAQPQPGSGGAPPPAMPSMSPEQAGGGTPEQAPVMPVQ